MSNTTEIEKAGKTNRADKVFLIVGLVFFLTALAVSIAFFGFFFHPINSTSYSLVVVYIVMWLINVVV